MDGEQPSHQDQPDASQTLAPSIPEPADAIQPAPATGDQLKKAERNIEERMTKFEKSSIRLGWMALCVAALAAAFVCLQWYEMRAGSVDTHKLAIAASKQATWTEELSEKMQTQADRTKDLADRMKDQAEETKTIADQTIVEAKAAKSSADTAAAELELSRRPWVVIRSAQIVEPLRIFSDGKMVTTLRITVENVGGSPASAVWPAVVPFVLNPTPGAEHQILQKLCSVKPNFIPQVGFFGQMVFPGPERGFCRNYSAEGKATSFKNHPKIYPLSGISVEGCIVYKSSYSEKTYASGFSYELQITHNGHMSEAMGVQFDSGPPLAPNAFLFSSANGEVVINPADITLVMPYIQPPAE